MRERNIAIFNLVLFTVFSFIIAGFQSSFWPSIFRVLSGTNLWIFPIFYFCLYRPFHIALLFVYINTLVLHGFTSASLGLLLAIQIIILLGCNFLRSRIFWNTVSYYLIVCAVGGVIYEAAFMLLSHLFEVQPMEQFSWRSALITLILSPAVGFLFFSLGRILDHSLPPQPIEGSQS